MWPSRVPLCGASAHGPRFTLWGGGEDTIFPHRENHGAQWPRGFRPRQGQPGFRKRGLGEAVAHGDHV